MTDANNGEDVSPAEPGTPLRLIPASETVMRPTRWLWTDRIPAGALTVIPGREGIGKSLTLAWLTAQLTRGTLPGQHHGVRRPVVYAASEDSWSHTIAPRLYAAGADLDMVYRVEVERDGLVDQLTLPRDCDWLATEIRQRGIGLVAADPLLSLISANIDTHRDRDLRTALEPLARMADSTDCAVVGLAHFNKSASPDALNLITGSRAFSAVARAVIAIARDPDAEDGSCVMSQAKNNLGRLDLPSLRYVIDTAEVATDEGPAHVGVLRFTGESQRSVSDILSDGAADHEPRGERDRVADWLREHLTAAGGTQAWAELRKAARVEGIAERTLRRAASRAGVTTERSGFPATTIWRIVTDDAASPRQGQSGQIGQSGQDPRAGRTGRTATQPTALTHPQSPLHLVPPPTGDAS